MLLRRLVLPSTGDGPQALVGGPGYSGNDLEELFGQHGWSQMLPASSSSLVQSQNGTSSTAACGLYSWSGGMRSGVFIVSTSCVSR